MSAIPVRVRLTAAFALAMVLVLAGSTLFVYIRLKSDLDESIDTGLRARADDVTALVSRGGSLSSPTDARLVEPDESFAQVLTPEGRVLDGTGGASEPSLTPEQARRASSRPLELERHVRGIESTARMLARPVSVEGRRHVAVAGASLGDRDETLDALIASFAIGTPIAVLAASGLGYLLAGVGLRPVEAMRRRAADISLERRGERLPLPRARDEIHRLGETLNSMLERLEASFERERRFVADASHELRTPLAVLKTELEAALAHGPEEAVRESLAAAIEEADQMGQLAEDLLLLARAGEGKLPVRPEPIEMREMLEQVRERFRERARRQGREIVVDAPAGLTWRLDPLRLRQALGNLLDNALRHGRGEIALAAARRDEGVEIDVSDRGDGFPDELGPRAFERFSRGGAARSGGGAGLGLAIVRAVAEAHGGSAAIEAAGNGATVRLRFP